MVNVECGGCEWVDAVEPDLGYTILFTAIGLGILILTITAIYLYRRHK